MDGPSIANFLCASLANLDNEVQMFRKMKPSQDFIHAKQAFDGKCIRKDGTCHKGF